MENSISITNSALGWPLGVKCWWSCTLHVCKCRLLIDNAMNSWMGMKMTAFCDIATRSRTEVYWCLRVYETTWHYIPESCHHHTHCCETLNSHTAKQRRCNSWPALVIGLNRLPVNAVFMCLTTSSHTTCFTFSNMQHHSSLFSYTTLHIKINISYTNHNMHCIFCSGILML
jgi:hypothetical protein